MLQGTGFRKAGAGSTVKNITSGAYYIIPKKIIRRRYKTQKKLKQLANSTRKLASEVAENCNNSDLIRHALFSVVTADNDTSIAARST